MIFSSSCTCAQKLPGNLINLPTQSPSPQLDYSEWLLASISLYLVSFCLALSPPLNSCLVSVFVMCVEILTRYLPPLLPRLQNKTGHYQPIFVHSANACRKPAAARTTIGPVLLLPLLLPCVSLSSLHRRRRDKESVRVWLLLVLL